MNEEEDLDVYFSSLADDEMKQLRGMLEVEVPDEVYDVPHESTTCWRCPSKDSCEYAFDPYNTDGECLANK